MTPNRPPSPVEGSDGFTVICQITESTGSEIRVSVSRDDYASIEFYHWPTDARLATWFGTRTEVRDALYRAMNALDVYDPKFFGSMSNDLLRQYVVGAAGRTPEHRVAARAEAVRRGKLDEFERDLATERKLGRERSQ